MKRVYAKWTLKILPEYLSDFHISCGRGDDQYEGFFISDKGATLSIKHGSDGLFTVYFDAPDDDGLTAHADHWMSPSTPGDVEADDWGSK